MLLSRDDILKEMERGNIAIEPFDPSLLGPESLDIRLGNEMLVARKMNGVINAQKPEDFFESVKISDEGFILKPGVFVLGATLERIKLSGAIAAQIEGRSSLGRLGVMVHVTAGIVHAGFGSSKPARLTLEIYSVNPNPVRLFPGMKIAQLSFFRLSSPVSQGYDDLPMSKYAGQDRPLPPKGDGQKP